MFVALAVVYLFGFVTGSLLVASDGARATLPWTIIRTVAGLLLAGVAFLLSLVLTLPWWVGPVLSTVLAIALGGRAALVVPLSRERPRVASAIGVACALVLTASVPLAGLRMGVGPFPPVFYNADTPYALEKVHALVRASSYPPQSLSNAGGRPPYHYLTHAVAALIARASGVAPHQSLFLITLPLLTAGIIASAAVIARHLCPSLSAALAIPAMLVPVPSFWYPFSRTVGPRIWQTITDRSLDPLRALAGDYELWGVASIVVHNVAAECLVLMTIAALASAANAKRASILPAWCSGTAILVKVQTGIVLVAGFLLTRAYQSLNERQWRPLIPAVAGGGVFLLISYVFFVAPSAATAFKVEPYPLFHLQSVRANDGVASLAIDVLLTVIPALVVWAGTWRVRGHGARPWLLFAVSPFLVVNATRAVDMRTGGGGATDDWLQILTPVPFLLRVWVLAFAGERWAALSVRFRRGFLVLLAITVLPSLIVAGRYAGVLMTQPGEGHEFVDNRSIAEALATIPIDGTVIVTNDLRYPAQGFSRDERQMQIPALFGHQAFAVNYRYERYEFSEERRRLQRLLQAPQWSPELDDGARKYGWTHLLIRKDFMHPDPIPLRRTFENDAYVVMSFR
jgi:hypothetical protein